ncbi:MAG: hypothetical protein M2R45_01993 [Verrucomicrobia subdivision 3 bacterium]|nr:hypothetical protein [Limisphaerales bacterium]MCS1414811.1 hypothetical protein [Limisphaerales bacterium]
MQSLSHTVILCKPLGLVLPSRYRGNEATVWAQLAGERPEAATNKVAMLDLPKCFRIIAGRIGVRYFKKFRMRLCGDLGSSVMKSKSSGSTCRAVSSLCGMDGPRHSWVNEMGAEREFESGAQAHGARLGYSSGDGVAYLIPG